MKVLININKKLNNWKYKLIYYLKNNSLKWTSLIKRKQYPYIEFILINDSFIKSKINSNK